MTQSGAFGKLNVLSIVEPTGIRYAVVIGKGDAIGRRRLESAVTRSGRTEALLADMHDLDNFLSVRINDLGS